jgi:hypothetical protein
MIARTVVEPEESAAEKIYATLRECREQADPKKQKGVKMQGYLVGFFGGQRPLVPLLLLGPTFFR